MWDQAGGGLQSGPGTAITDISPQEVGVCLGGGLRAPAKLLAPATPSGHRAGYPGSHPMGLWAQEWLPPAEDDKKSLTIFHEEFLTLSFYQYRYHHHLKMRERLPTCHGGTLAAESLFL